jgi:hypothetical protein
MMQKREPTRRHLHRALSCAGLTVRQFARDRCHVSETFLHLWLSGERDSKRVEAEVRRFIREQIPAIKRETDAIRQRYAQAA